jgi:hypothetical protein
MTERQNEKPGIRGVWVHIHLIQQWERSEELNAAASNRPTATGSR